MGFNLTPALLTKKVDAVLGAFWNYEGTELRAEGPRPQIIRVDEAGVPTYDELVLVANEDALERDSERIRAFIGALARGTEDLEKDPEKGIKGLLEANPDLDPELQREVVKVTLPLFLPKRGQAVRLSGSAGVAGVHRVDEREQAYHGDPGRDWGLHQRLSAGLRAVSNRRVIGISRLTRA